jgi:eukaryotic-like serine/threonine-protein kinase
MIEKTLGHYRVGEQLGRGGMGEVYVADDLNLNRKVALKFLPDAFAGDPERMARFEREARLLASLNHPNIAAIYGLEQSEDKRFLVLELVDGETLAQRISKGALLVDEALAICRQIAEGLEAAHEKGVIHRDLKPANVMITEGDKVKILDFGLAKALSDDSQSIDSSQSPTLTEAMTRPGVILGTAAYMSPEQAKGKSVDRRADIWAFGCILYECLAGKRAFEGETVTETLASVLTKEPELDRSPAKAHALLRRCLEKDPKKRLRDIGEAAAWIESAPESLPAKRSWVSWSIAAVCLIGALAIGFLYFNRVPVEAPVMRLEIHTPPTTEPASLAISPDGRRLAFAAEEAGRQKLWIRLLDQTKAQPLEGTDGAVFPFWSPDGRSMGFFAEGKLKRIDVSGGPPQSLADAPVGLGGTWNSDGVIVFAPNALSPLYRVADSGGNPVAVTQLDAPESGGGHLFPWFLPDGERLLYYSWGSGGSQGIYLGSLTSPEKRQLMPTNGAGIYANPGYLLFLRAEALFAQQFDARNMSLSGDPVRIVDSVRADPTFGNGAFSVSETGLMVYRTTASGNYRKLAWFDRSGKEIGTLWDLDDKDLLNPELSPDGSRIAVNRSTQENPDVWLMETARGARSRLTLSSSPEDFQAWAPDGNRIVFGSFQKGTWDLYQKTLGGPGNDDLLFQSAAAKFPNDWSPDGRFILFITVDPKSARDLWILPLFGDRKPYPFVQSVFDERNGQFSPDGKWIAYQSNESGIFEIYVQSFPGPGNRRQISTGGGSQPRWRRDGKELFYISPDGTLMAVPIGIPGQAPNPGVPVPLFKTRIVGGVAASIQKAQYAVAPDGRRFLINVTIEESVASPITVVTNWAQSLKK